MKLLYPILVIFLCCVLIFGCGKPLSEEEEPILIEPTILWKARQGPGLKPGQNFARPYIFDDKIFISTLRESSKYGFYGIDKNDGKLLENFDVSSSNFGNQQFNYSNQFIYINDGTNFEAMNLESKKTFYKNECVSDARIEVFDYNIYLPFNLKSKAQPNKFGALTINLNDPVLKIDTLFVHEFDFTENAYEAKMGIPLVNINSIGDTMMYFVSKYNGTGKPEESKLYIHGFNISNREMAWSFPLPDTRMENDFPLVNLFSDAKPIIVDEKLYIATQTNLFCFDVNVQEILWKSQVEDLNGFSMIRSEDYIFTLNQEGRLIKIDRHTGQIVGEISDLGVSTRPWIEHKGIIYFTTGSNKLYAFDASKNEIIWSIKSPNQSNYCTGFFGQNSPIVDPETDLLYIADNFEIFCYELPSI